MKRYKIQYCTQRRSPQLNSYYEEIIEARGIKHAHTLATDHAKILNTKITSIKEITE